MARTILTTEAVEKSTYVVPVTFRDENGTSVAPTAATWTLTSEYGAVINSRSDVAISPLAATVNIVLTGADLAMLGELDNRTRLLLVEATYNSSLGTGLNLRDEIEFSVRPLVGVTS